MNHQNYIQVYDWPEPIKEMLIKCNMTESSSLQHQQLIYFLGTILRTISSLLVSQYLRDATLSNQKIDICIATDLRRPSYGNLLAFLRACQKSKHLDWKEFQPLILALNKLFKLENNGMPNTHKDLKLLDAFISYRNQIIHGGAALEGDSALERIPILKDAICKILNELDFLKKCKFISGEMLQLQIEDKFFHIIPLASQNQHSIIGIMEGYNNNKQTLKFVSTEASWESNQGWSEWEVLMQERGIFPKHWDDVDESWIQKRSISLLPEVYHLPTDFQIDNALYDKIAKCIENNLVYTSDVDLTVALLIHLSEQHYCFVMMANDLKQKGIFEELSEVLGMYPNIRNLPEDHHLEQVFRKVKLIMIENTKTIKEEYSQIIKDYFPQIEIIRVAPKPLNDVGLSFDKDLYLNLIQCLFKEEAQSINLKDLSLQMNDALNAYKSLLFITKYPFFIKNKVFNPISFGQSLMENHMKLDDDLILENLFKCCHGNFHSCEQTVLDSLIDLGLLKYKIDGTLNFVDDWAMNAVYSTILTKASGRPKKRFLSDVPLSVSVDFAKILFQNAREHSIPKNSKGYAVYLAYQVFEQSVKSLEAFVNLPHQVLMDSCILLVTWGRPDLVDTLVKQIWVKTSEQERLPFEKAFEIAMAIRKHGSPDLAIELLETISDNPNKNSIQAKHQLAGVYRDRGTRKNRLKAISIYKEILNTSGISQEQRVRSGCGAAECLYLLGRYSWAQKMLRQILQEAAVNPYLSTIIKHRLSTAYLHEGNHDEALVWSTATIQYFQNKFSGAFASRCLDMHARILMHVNKLEEAKAYLDISLSIKRALGDRLGLQKGLVALSSIIWELGLPHPEQVALEALTLAQHSQDLVGQQFIHKHLSNILKKQPEKRSYHLAKVAEIKQLIKSNGERGN